MTRGFTHHLLVLLLSLALAGSAFARPAASLHMQTQEPGTITMVICAGGSATTVVLGHDGMPVEPGPGHDGPPCPICTAPAEATLVAPVTWALPLRTLPPHAAIRQGPRQAGTPNHRPRARGPPEDL